MGEARRWVAGLLRTWERDDLVYTATLLLSEAVTNSIRHAQSAVGVVAKRANGGVRIEVWDNGGSDEPRLLHPSVEDERGRGLVIVDAMADTWGVLSGRRGRGVYFEIGS